MNRPHGCTRLFSSLVVIAIGIVGFAAGASIAFPNELPPPHSGAPTRVPAPSSSPSDFSGDTAVHRPRYTSLLSQDPAAGTDEDYVSDEEYRRAAADAVASEVKYGEPSVDYTRSFLRTQTPLLAPGRTQWDVGARYTIFEADAPTIVGTTLTEATITARRLEMPVGMRYGLTRNSQFFASTTVGWQETEIYNGFFSLDESSGGIGDLDFGINYLLLAESMCGPAVITTFDVTAPTGNPQSPLLLADSGMGAGYWATSSRILMYRTFDPVVAFWGGGYRFTFEEDYGNDQIDAGDQIFYQFGVGFAASRTITLSTAYLGSFITDLEINGNRVEGTAYDLGTVRMAATMVRCQRIYEPFVEIGVTQRSPAVSCGFLITR
ncbi:MAG: hypothetical protein KatS3mg111_2707 [Pirellulaceae bacterium]|nr:MAG: hypothetical protein KatS3mg111_2707 [Pirellulaceae bacterium]